MSWTAARGPVALQLHGDRTFDYRNMFRSKSYFLALLERERILGTNDYLEIEHDKPAVYYECLLYLDPRALSEMRTHPDFTRFKNPFFLRFLRANSVDLHGVMDREEAVLHDDLEAHALLPVLRVPSVASKGVSTRNGRYIHFDNFSHISGARSAFIKCGNADHETASYKCQRYCTVHLFTSERDACAFLLAWQMDGYGTSSREEHRLFFPSDDQLKKALELIP